jgi:hypothetical protein
MSEQATRVLLRLIEARLNGSHDPELTEDEVSSSNGSQITASARQHHLSGRLFKAVRRGKLESRLPQRNWAAVDADYYAHVARNLVLLNDAETLTETTRRFRALLLFLRGSVRETLSPCVSKRSPFLSALVRRMTFVNRHDLSGWSRSPWSARAAARTETSSRPSFQRRIKGV